MSKPISAEENDVLEFAEEPPAGASNDAAQGLHAAHHAELCWDILIVDDDHAVHDATRYAIGDTEIEGRRINLLHAYSSAESKDFLAKHPDIAVILLDVVMENESAGLNLVHSIRNELGLHALRIILRTGQPGRAPELQIIRDYDINDYKLKSELTQTALLTTLTSAIRSYSQICTILASRKGLSIIVDSAPDLLSCRSLKEFSHGILSRLSALIAQPLDNFIICAQDRAAPDSDELTPIMVIAAEGAYEQLIDHPLSELKAKTAASTTQTCATQTFDFITQCLEAKRSQFLPTTTGLFLSGDQERDAAIYFTTKSPLSGTERQLLDVFCVNVAVGLKNIGLFGDLHFLAYSDPLTSLFNRKGFINAINQRDKKITDHWTIALIDLDHFAEINDALGHERGDALLTGVAQRLIAHFGEPCALARVSGDVFGILAPDGLLDPTRFPKVFADPILVDGYQLQVSFTSGLSRLTGETVSGLDLFKTTSIALKHAKHDMRGRWQYHTEAMSELAKTRLDLVYQLRKAITQQIGLEVHYQPQMELLTGRMIGVEALLRWKTENGQSISPDRFITLAEYSGLMVSLGEWVFRTAIKQLMDWDAAGLPPFRLAINLSMTQFRAPNCINRLKAILLEYKVPPHRIELEITESIAMLDVDTVIQNLTEFKALGIEIAVDDFGTGFSSLAYLHRLPLDRLKIDRSFVQAMGAKADQGNTDSGSNISEMVINLAHSFGLTVIAEGVETEAQAKQLTAMGCEFAQGYLYSPALPPSQIPTWLKNRAK